MDQQKEGSLSQTDIYEEGCETCFVAQNLLKFLADTVIRCLSVYSEDHKSQIAEFREELKESVWGLTQRKVVVSWCQAVESDCQNLLQNTQTILMNNATLTNKVDSLKLTSEEEFKHFSLQLENIQKQLITSEEVLQKEKKQLKKLSKQKDSILTKSNDLEVQLQKKVDECIQQTTDIEQLKITLQTLESSQIELHAVYATTLTELDDTKSKLEEEKDEKNALSRRVGGLETQLEIKDQEISHLKETLEKCKAEVKEKLLFRKLMEKAKVQLETYKRTEKIHEETKQRNETEIKHLKEEVEQRTSQVELLTLYPDLNGPINPPTRDTGNPVDAMEMQVKSNQIRIDVLKGQTERLNTTISKLRCHLQTR